VLRCRARVVLCVRELEGVLARVRNMCLCVFDSEKNERDAFRCAFVIIRERERERERERK
jgi:hypothetical protein